MTHPDSYRLAPLAPDGRGRRCYHVLVPRTRTRMRDRRGGLVQLYHPDFARAHVDALNSQRPGARRAA